MYVTRPILAPCTVTEVEPVCAWFDFVAELIDMSDVQTFVVDWMFSPAVMITLLVPRIPCPTRQLIDVADSHLVVSQDVRPILPPCEYDDIPRLLPCNVTIAVPVCM